jgi:hypothetical protein
MQQVKAYLISVFWLVRTASFTSTASSITLPSIAQNSCSQSLRHNFDPTFCPVTVNWGIGRTYLIDVNPWEGIAFGKSSNSEEPDKKAEAS